MFVSIDGWVSAHRICQDIGARLCTALELEMGEAYGTGCMSTLSQIWTSTPCAGGMMSCNGGNVGSNVPTCQTDLTQNLGSTCCAEVNPPPLQVKPPTFPAASEVSDFPSPLTCEQLGQTVGHGSKAVCGQSMINGQCNTTGLSQAASICRAVGQRLCTRVELANGEARGTGCDLDTRQVWTSDCCDGGHWSGRGGGAESGSQFGTCQTDRAVELGVTCCGDFAGFPVPEHSTAACSDSTSFRNPPLDIRARLDGQALLLRNLRVEGNEVLGAGGLNLGSVLTVAAASSLSVEYVEFVGNVQKGVGAGVIFALDNSTVTVGFSAFEQNRNDGYGSGAIYASSSTINVSMSHFKGHAVKRRLAGDTGTVPSASCILAEASKVFLEHISFSGNSGADVIVATLGSVIAIQHSAFESNSPDSPGNRRQLQTTGNDGSFGSRAPLSVLEGSVATLRSSSFADNAGLSSGGVFVNGAGSALTFVHLHFKSNRGTGADAAAGCIFASNGASVSGSRSSFDDNSATSQFAAGVILAQDAAVTLSGSNFSSNQAAEHPTAGSNAGAGVLVRKPADPLSRP